MARRLGAGAWVVLGMWLAGEVTAEASDVRIVVGDRIRYGVDVGNTKKAVVIEAGADWLRVQDEKGDGAAHRIEKAQLRSLKVLRGQRRRVLEGAAIGFVPGAVFGWAAVRALCDAGSDCNEPAGALILGGLSAALGAAVGALVKTDRWEDAPLSRVRFGLAPMRGGGVRAAISVSF